VIKQVPLLEDSEIGRLSSHEAEQLQEQARAYLLEQAQEQVGRSELMKRLEAGTLSRSALQKFWLNWHSQVWEINSLITASYHLFTPFFKRNLDLLALFADKVADEMIHPKPPGHMLVVWEQGEIFGLTRDQMLHYSIDPECRALMEWHRGLLHEGTMFEFWTMISYEEYTGYWSKDFWQALAERYGYHRAQVPYFKIHEEADLEEHDGIMGHAMFNWIVLRRMLEQGEGRLRPGFSIRYIIDTELTFRRRFLDACAGGSESANGH